MTDDDSLPEPIGPRRTHPLAYAAFGVLALLVVASALSSLGGNANSTFSFVGSNIKPTGGGNYAAQSTTPPFTPLPPGGPPGAVVEPTKTGETYAGIAENPFRLAQTVPLSTFSADVNSASYSNVRR